MGSQSSTPLPGDGGETGRPTGELPAAAESFRVLAEIGPQLVWLCDSEGRASYVNPQWCEYTGLTPAETCDLQRVGQTVHPDDLPALRATWHAAGVSGGLFEAEYRLRRADGTYRWFLVRAVAVKDSTGRPVQWVGASTDIDDRKRAEEALKEAGRRKDEFLAMLGHELRNPLAPLRSALSILRLAAPGNPVVRQAGELMDRQVGQMARLIDDLLDVSRIARGKISLRQERCDLVPLVRAAAEDYRGVLESAALELKVVLPDQPLWVQGDPTRLAQAIGNLLHNAHKFTDPGGNVTVTLTGEADTAVIVVRDTGIGIEPEQLTQVFEAFNQAASSPLRNRGGLGLGLALVKWLIEMHGGRVSAASAGPGRGAEFSIRLPLAA
jgi:PAS domain S-box-containing protein